MYRTELHLRLAVVIRVVKVMNEIVAAVFRENRLMPRSPHAAVGRQHHRPSSFEHRLAAGIDVRPGDFLGAPDADVVSALYALTTSVERDEQVVKISVANNERS